MGRFVSRGGEKLEHALSAFGIDVHGLICADFGSNVGGFVDCLLSRGAAKVYAIDTGYGALDWKLRNDPRVLAMERTNAMHVTLPQKMDLVTIDVAWTRQRNILPAARAALNEGGSVVALVKPHYEADRRQLIEGVLPESLLCRVIESVKSDIAAAGFRIEQTTSSPILGAGGNRELLAHLRPDAPPPAASPS